MSNDNSRRAANAAAHNERGVHENFRHRHGSPLLACVTWDNAKNVAKRMIQSPRADFWRGQSQSLLARDAS